MAVAPSREGLASPQLAHAWGVDWGAGWDERGLQGDSTPSPAAATLDDDGETTSRLQEFGLCGVEQNISASPVCQSLNMLSMPYTCGEVMFGQAGKARTVRRVCRPRVLGVLINFENMHPGSSPCRGAAFSRAIP